MDIKPNFLRTVGRWRANDFSFGMGYFRCDIPEDSFGFIGANFCDRCKRGFDEEMEYHRTFKGNYWQPEEGIEVCPHCGSDEAGENQQDHNLKATKRYSIHMNPKYRETV